MLEAEHGDAARLRRRLEQRQRRPPSAFRLRRLRSSRSTELQCPSADASTKPPTPRPTADRTVAAPRPARQLPPWIPCDGFAGLLAYEAPGPNGARRPPRAARRRAAADRRAAVGGDRRPAVHQRHRDSGCATRPASVSARSARSPMTDARVVHAARAAARRRGCRTTTRRQRRSAKAGWRFSTCATGRPAPATRRRWPFA